MPEKEPQGDPSEEIVPATDQEIVDHLILHIDNPCEVDVGQETHNIRNFYIKEARRLLDESNKGRIMDTEQIERLKRKIKEYEQK